MAYKCMDNWSVMLFLSALEEMNDKLSVDRREKSPKTKSSVPYTKVVKLCNSNMGGVDLLDQRTAPYRLDRKSSVIFYLRNFFDLMDIAFVNSYLIYNKMSKKLFNQLSLLDYKIVIIKNLIQYHQGWKISTNVETI